MFAPTILRDPALVAGLGSRNLRRCVLAAQTSSEEMRTALATHSQLKEQLQDLMAALDSRDQRISSLTRENVTQSSQSEDDLKRAQAAGAELQRHVESLRTQVCEHTESMSEMKASRAQLEKRHADQVGICQLTVSCTLVEKLMASCFNRLPAIAADWLDISVEINITSCGP